jgi:hypothetical protein
MTSISTALKVLNKVGYPSDGVTDVLNAIDVDPNTFLEFLYHGIGREKTKDFIERTLSALHSKDNDGIKIDLGYGNDSYVYLIVERFEIYENELDYVIIDHSFKKTHIFNEESGEYQTLQEIYENLDMGEFGDYEDLMNDIVVTCRDFLFDRTSFVFDMSQYSS